MEGVRLPGPKIKNCYLKIISPSMLPNTTLDFISDMEVTHHRYYDR